MKNIYPPNLSGPLGWTHILPIACALLLAGVAAHAHHSFAVFFDADRTVSVRGTVVDFQFRNPHGLIRIKTTDKDGKESVWKAETNSPSILERRGWARDTLKAGEVITMEGWPARDGSNYLRLRTVKRADGTLVGKPLASSDEQ
jgi:Family of unknown function (DUF6152)